MTLWHIEDGIPSVADGLLVAGGMVGGIALLVAVGDPFLDFFEARGLLYLGYALLFLVFGGLGGLGFLVFWRNQNKLRPEIRFPRLVFAFSAPPLIFIFHTLAIVWLFPAIHQKKITFGDASRVVDLSLIVVFVVLYALVVRLALRWPTRTTSVALWFSVCLGMVGVAAKILRLVLHK